MSMSIPAIEQLEKTLQSLPEYNKALELVRQTRKMVSQVQPVLTPEAISTRGQWDHRPEPRPVSQWPYT
jgi:hypothetical protein